MTTNEIIQTIKAAGIAANVGVNRNPHPYGIAIYVRARGKSFFEQAEAETTFKIVSALGLKNHGNDYDGDADLAGYCCAQGFNYLI
jgi:hypothetical protein